MFEENIHSFLKLYEIQQILINHRTITRYNHEAAYKTERLMESEHIKRMKWTYFQL